MTRHLTVVLLALLVAIVWTFAGIGFVRTVWGGSSTGGAYGGALAQFSPVPSGPSPLYATSTSTLWYGGTATWMCNPGGNGGPRSRCTRGHGYGEMAVGVPWRLRHTFPIGSRVRICRSDRPVCVVVKVVDVNACVSWDLFAVAFRKLAPLSVGRIVVTVRREP